MERIRSKALRSKALHSLLMLMLMLGLMVCVSAAVYADDDYTINYMEATLENDTVVFSNKTTSTYTVIGNTTTEWNGGFYVVDGTVTISDPVSVTGNTNLILCDNAQLEVQSGIVIDVGSTLNIYPQNQSDTGKLIVKGSNGVNDDYGQYGYSGPFNGTAGIDGTVIVHGGDVQIDGGNGGSVKEENAHGDSHNGANAGAGLVGTITVYDGVVTITGGEGGQGYAGGSSDPDNRGDGGDGGHGIEGTASVYGGKLTAVGCKGCQGDDAPGGAGAGGNGGHGINGYTEINGGIVKATGGEGGKGGTGVIPDMNGSTGSPGKGMNGSIYLGSNVTLYGDDNEITSPNESIAHVSGPQSGLNISSRFTYADSVHTHIYRYEAGTDDKANTISAACKGTRACCNTTSVTITLNKPTDLAYDGNAKEATISGYPTTTVENLAAVPAIKYFKSTGAGSTETSGNELTGAPKEAGDYVAQITWGGATASVAFSIVGPAQYQLVFDPGEGSGTMDPVNVTDGQTYTFPKCTFKPPKNKSFDHWKMSGVDGIFYPGKTTTIASNCVQNGVITVTAYWKDGAEPTPTPTEVIVAPTTSMTAGKTTMSFAWEKVEGVDGYDIFFSRCNHGDTKEELVNVKTIEGNDTFDWKNSGLKPGTSYKAYVKAYVMTSSGKQYVMTSPLMHAYTDGGSKKYTNAKSVKVNKKNVSVKVGKTFKLKAKVKKLKRGRKLMPKKHVAKVRYLSTDTSIATVSKKGKIKGVKAGTCYVYAYAHNGVFKKVKVTVK